MDIIADIFRAIVIAEAASVFYFISAILKDLKKLNIVNRRSKGNLDSHVILIATSYLVMTVFLCISVGTRFGMNSLSWQSFMSFFALGIGCIGLFLRRWDIKKELQYPYR